MKRIINTAIVYFIFAMAGGVFYREFTKWNGYTEPTTLGVLHVHLLVMGTLLFLITALFAKVTMLAENLLFKKFFVLYNIALPAMVVMMLIRGIVQVLGIELGKMGNGIVSYRNDDCTFLTAVCDKKGIDTKTIGIMIFRVIVNCLRTIHRRDEQFYKQRKPANLPANGFRCFYSYLKE